MEKGQDGEGERESRGEREMERGRNTLASPSTCPLVSPQCLHSLKLLGSQEARETGKCRLQDLPAEQKAEEWLCLAQAGMK